MSEHVLAACRDVATRGNWLVNCYEHVYRAYHGHTEQGGTRLSNTERLYTVQMRYTWYFKASDQLLFATKKSSFRAGLSLKTFSCALEASSVHDVTTIIFEAGR